MNMMNRIKKIIALVLAVIAVALLIPQDTVAATTCIVRVPFESKVIVNGRQLTDKDMVDYGYMDGRIQRIATEKYNAIFYYKDYKVTVGNLDEVQVYDKANTKLTYTIRDGAVLDFTSSNDPAFLQAVDSRVKDCARAYHNRVGGYSSTAITLFVLSGSDAYNKCIGSDAGRKWGQYMRAQNITAINVSEVFRYSPEMFSAKVDIQASGTGTETYSIYLLFRYTKGNYYITDFTFQD